VSRIGAIGQQRQDKEAYRMEISCASLTALRWVPKRKSCVTASTRMGRWGSNMVNRNINRDPCDAHSSPECSAYACSKAQMRLHDQG
jgi:hypothetical protein